MNSTNKRRQHTRWTEERKQQLAEAYARGGNREACRVFPECTAGSLAAAATTFQITRRDQPIRVLKERALHVVSGVSA